MPETPNPNGPPSRKSHTGIRLGRDATFKGFAYARPTCLEPIGHRIHLTDDGYRVAADFSIAWDGPPDRRIYVQNAARHSHGIADPNLSLTAWRSAVIVNSVCGQEVYDVNGSSGAITWPQDPGRAPEHGTREDVEEMQFES